MMTMWGLQWLDFVCRRQKEKKTGRLKDKTRENGKREGEWSL